MARRRRRDGRGGRRPRRPGGALLQAGLAAGTDPDPVTAGPPLVLYLMYT